MSNYFKNIIAQTDEERKREDAVLKAKVDEVKTIADPISEMHRIVREYVTKHDLKYNEAYRQLYDAFKYTYHLDLLVRAMNTGKRAMDIIKQQHKEYEILALAKELFA